jgi:serine/threonine-protein kinase RsbW
MIGEESGQCAVVPRLEASWPPDTTTAVRRWTLDGSAQLKLLRAALHEAVLGEPVPGGKRLDAVPEKMLLVATELATNALTHAHPPTVVELRRTGDTFILDVTDDDPDTEPEIAETGSTRSGGRGLRLARELALDIGWYTEGGVKRVWAEFALPAA